GFALFDRDDRLIAWNQLYIDCFVHLAGFVRVGMTFREIAAHSACFLDTDSEAARAAWLAWRLDEHARRSGSFEQVLPNGRS
ncbi:PAS-domain containing protein, partial [Acinetobacter baumannii]